MLQTDDGPRDQAVENALIEAFCIHTRNLIIFLNSGDKVVRAKSFAGEDFKPKVVNKINRSLREKLDRQIAHLDEKRTMASEDKVTAADRIKLFELVDRDFEFFLRSLPEKYIALWEVGRPTGPNTIRIAEKLGPTNAIGIIATDGSGTQREIS